MRRAERLIASADMSRRTLICRPCQQKPRARENRGAFPWKRKGFQPFVIVMLTPRISPLDEICTVCLEPLVRRDRLAAKPLASTNTSIWPPPAGALKVAEDVAVGLAPIAGDALALAGHVAGEVELVAVRRAVQRLLEAETGASDLVVGLAADALGRAVGERHGAGAGPRAVEAGERPGRLSMACRN